MAKKKPTQPARGQLLAELEVLLDEQTTIQTQLKDLDTTLALCQAKQDGIVKAIEINRLQGVVKAYEVSLTEKRVAGTEWSELCESILKRLNRIVGNLGDKPSPESKSMQDELFKIIGELRLKLGHDL